MFKMTAMGLALAFAVATGARAAVPVLALPGVSGPVTKVGEGCGSGRWRDRFGNCHWFGGPGGSNRGTAIECPPGTHIGPGRGRCWPNG